MKTITLKVKIRFSEHIEENDLQEVVGNCLQALVSEVQGGMGLSPENGSAVTQEIEVRTETKYKEFVDSHTFPELI